MQLIGLILFKCNLHALKSFKLFCQKIVIIKSRLHDKKSWVRTRYTHRTESGLRTKFTPHILGSGPIINVGLQYCACDQRNYYAGWSETFRAYHGWHHSLNTVESRFLEPSVSRTSRYLEPNLVSLGFTSLKLYNFTPDFSNPRFLETPDNSNQFFSRGTNWPSITRTCENFETT